MPDRPAIPADLRRRVLLEAGHRCAIHTCRHVDVDVHHIVPWAREREHRFENLIALCPNCHRRADAGDIDRQSLRLYKARLAAPFHFEETNFYPAESVLPAGFAWVDPSEQWSTRELVKEESKLEAGLEYPQFRGRTLGAATANVNRHIRERIEATLSRFLADIADLPDVQTSIPHQLHSSFSVALLRSSVVSVRFTMAAYSGGAHGSHWTEPLNLLVTPLRELGIADIFQDPTAGLTALSAYAIDQLLAPSQDRPLRMEALVRRGAGPDPRNYCAFNLTSRGVLVTFDEYQVGCYAEGPSEVHVPYHVLSHSLSPFLTTEILGEGA